MDEIYSKRNKEHNRRFINAIPELNFKSNKSNAILLFYGYTRESINDLHNMIYHKIPKVVILRCIEFCYNFLDINFDGDMFNKHLMDKQYKCNFTLSSNDTQLSWIGNNCYKVMAFGKYEISRPTIRKLWRIKILQKKYSDETIQSTYFKIGIAFKDEPKELCYQVDVNGDNDDEYGMIVGAEDVISMLYTRDKDDGLKGELRFAVNGYQVMQQIEIPPSASHKILCITMFDPCFDLELLN